MNKTDKLREILEQLWIDCNNIPDDGTIHDPIGYLQDQALSAIQEVYENETKMSERIDKAVKDINPYLFEKKQLQSEVERLKKKLKLDKSFCDVCWTSSWAPVPKDFPNARQIKGSNEYVVCEMCRAEAELNRLKGENDKLFREQIELEKDKDTLTTHLNCLRSDIDRLKAKQELSINEVAEIIDKGINNAGQYPRLAKYTIAKAICERFRRRALTDELDK